VGNGSRRLQAQTARVNHLPPHERRAAVPRWGEDGTGGLLDCRSQRMA